ncbi:SHOCT domain-containing protein [Halalkalicoccus sp. NIPERK01]|uniref:SHOCT domain-containing protein n=1 Tax=Halalkalicoccus sp. NIPERK01 TaxID=3053469 RepID=UPI00256EF381|nr:SHOCT domain-containing protein [Halalkalicoccus sp. NIPERK01]MDL5360669.1 SHOCT domain-containing protein [Halalkalicoccus sp. NIPERK01]
MSLESRIEAGGRRALRSPLWVGLLITAFLVVPTFLVPGIPLWIALVSLVTLAPLVLLGTYAVYHLYWWVTGSNGEAGDAGVVEPDGESPLERLRYRYATGEIDEATFERTLERLLETEPRKGRTAAYNDPDLLRE